MPPSNNRAHRKYIHDNQSNDKELSLKINKYYSSTSWDYRLVWSHRHLHFGYWDSDTRSHRESLINMNRHVARKAGLSANTHILDAGCGVGGLSTWLAKEYDATVSGITICQSQLVQARQFAIQDDVQERTNFHLMDFTCTDFPDQTFDAVVAIESVCHAKDKNDFLREAWRLLKPGGRLVIADGFRSGGVILSRRDEHIMQSWSSGWAVPELATDKMFCRQAAAAGFSGINLQDITVNTLPSHRRLFMLGCFGYPFEWSLWKLGLRSDTQHGNIRAALDQWHLIKRKLCFYGLFTATKNVNKN